MGGVWFQFMGGGVNNDPGATLIHILGGGGKKMSA